MKSATASKKFPADYLKIGYVYMHPNDDRTRFPPAVLRENPATFVPRKDFDGDDIERVHMWGLYSEDEDPNDMMAVMKRMMGANNNYMYGAHENPLSQFIGVLLKRKMAKIESDPVIQNAVANKSLTIRGIFSIFSMRHF